MSNGLTINVSVKIDNNVEDIINPENKPTTNEPTTDIETNNPTPETPENNIGQN